MILMLKKGILFIVVLVGMIGLNTGFFNKHVDMNFIQKPDMMYIVSNLHENEINVLLKQLDEISKQQGSEAQQSALNQAIQDLYAKDVVQTTDKGIINLITNDLKKTNDFMGLASNGMKKNNAVIDNGNIMPPKSGVYYKVYFQYNAQMQQETNQQVIDTIKKGYIPYIFIFPNNMAYVPVYDGNQKSQISTVKIRINEADMKSISTYYKANLPK
jgi:hypothetical protein